MKKFLSIFAAVVVVVVAVVVVNVLLQSVPKEEIVPQLADDIALYMQDQSLSRNGVVAVAALNEPGFVVVREAKDGAMGSVVGLTALLQSGRSENIRLSFARQPVEGEVFSAMLYSDTNSNGIFDEGVDQSMQDKANQPVFASFTTKTQ